MHSVYGWIIDLHKWSTINEIPATGPRDLSTQMFAQLRNGHGDLFRMLDDDGEVYFHGRIVGDYTGFEPLDDYGTPGYGCTEIQYYNQTTKLWETL